MTIKEVAQQAGISHQAIYKKLKNRGIKTEDLKDAETGELSEKGLEILKDLIESKNDDDLCGDKVESEVEKLRGEIEKLRNEVEHAEEKIHMLTEERDFLRTALNRAQTALDQAQKLQAITSQKIPAALPAPEKRGIFGWFSRRREKKDQGE